MSLTGYRSYREQGNRTSNPHQVALDDLTVGNMHLLGKMTGQLQWEGNVGMKAPGTIRMEAPHVTIVGASTMSSLEVTETAIQADQGVGWPRDYKATADSHYGLQLAAHPTGVATYDPPIAAASSSDRPVWLGAPTEAVGGWFTPAARSHVVQSSGHPVAGHQWVHDGKVTYGASETSTTDPTTLDSFVSMDVDNVVVQASGQIHLAGKVDHEGEWTSNHSVVTARESDSNAAIGWQAGTWDSAAHTHYSAFAQLLATPNRLQASVGTNLEASVWTAAALADGSQRMQVHGNHGSGIEDADGAVLRSNGDTQPTALRLSRVRFVQKTFSAGKGFHAAAARGQRVVGVNGTTEWYDTTTSEDTPWTTHTDPNNQQILAAAISDGFRVVGGTAYACHVCVAEKWIQVVGWPASANLSSEESIEWIVAGSRHFSLVSRVNTTWIVRDVSWAVNVALPPTLGDSWPLSSAAVLVGLNTLEPKGDVIAVAGEDAGPWVTLRTVSGSGIATLTLWIAASNQSDVVIAATLTKTNVQLIALGGRRFVVQSGATCWEVSWASGSAVVRSVNAAQPVVRVFPWLVAGSEWGWVAHASTAVNGFVAGQVMRRNMDLPLNDANDVDRILQVSPWDSWVANDRLATWWHADGLATSPRWVGMTADYGWVWMNAAGTSIGVVSTSVWKRTRDEPSVLEVDGTARVRGSVVTDSFESDGTGDVVMFGEQTMQDIRLGKKAKRLVVECPVEFLAATTTTEQTTLSDIVADSMQVGGTTQLAETTATGLAVTDTLTLDGTSVVSRDTQTRCETDATERVNGSWIQRGGSWTLDDVAASVSGNLQMSGGWLTVDAAKIRTTQGVAQTMSVVTSVNRWHVVGGWVTSTNTGRDVLANQFRRTSMNLTAGIWVVGLGRVTDASASEVPMIRLEIGTRTVADTTGCWQLTYWGTSGQTPSTPPVSAVAWLNVGNASDVQSILGIQTGKTIEWQWTISSWMDVAISTDMFQVATSNYLNVQPAKTVQLFSKVVPMEAVDIRRQIGTTNTQMAQVMNTSGSVSGQWSVLAGTAPVGTWTMNRSVAGNTDNASLTLGSSVTPAWSVARNMNTGNTTISCNADLLTNTIRVQSSGLVVASGGIRVDNDGLLVSAGGAQVTSGGLKVEAGGIACNGGTIVAGGTGLRVNAGGLTVAAGATNPVSVLSPATFSDTSTFTGASTFGGTATFNGSTAVNGAVRFANTMVCDGPMVVSQPVTMNGTMTLNRHVNQNNSRAGVAFRGASVGWYSIGKFIITGNLEDFPTIQVRFIGAQGEATVFSQFAKLDSSGTAAKLNRQFYVEQLDAAETTIFDRVGWKFNSKFEMELWVRTAVASTTGAWFMDTFCGTFTPTNPTGLVLDTMVTLTAAEEAALVLVSRSMRFGVDALTVQTVQYPRQMSAASNTTPWIHIATLTGSMSSMQTQKCLFILIGGTGVSNAATTYIMVTFDNSGSVGSVPVVGWYYTLGGGSATVATAFVGDVQSVNTNGVIQLWIQTTTASAFSVQAVPSGLTVSFSSLSSARSSAPTGGAALTAGWETRGNVTLGGRITWPSAGGVVRANQSVTTELQNLVTGQYYSAWSVSRDQAQFVDPNNTTLFQVDKNGHATVTGNVISTADTAAVIGKTTLNFGFRDGSSQFAAMAIGRQVSGGHEFQVMNAAGSAPVARINSSGDVRVANNLISDTGALYLNNASGGAINTTPSLTVNTNNGTSYQPTAVVSYANGLEVRSKTTPATVVCNLDGAGNITCAGNGSFGGDITCTKPSTTMVLTTDVGLTVKRWNTAKTARYDAMAVNGSGVEVRGENGTLVSTLTPDGHLRLGLDTSAVIGNTKLNFGIGAAGSQKTAAALSSAKGLEIKNAEGLATALTLSPTGNVEFGNQSSRLVAKANLNVQLDSGLVTQFHTTEGLNIMDALDRDAPLSRLALDGSLTAHHGVVGQLVYGTLTATEQLTYRPLFASTRDILKANNTGLLTYPGYVYVCYTLVDFSESGTITTYRGDTTRCKLVSFSGYQSIRVFYVGSKVSTYSPVAGSPYEITINGITNTNI